MNAADPGVVSSTIDRLVGLATKSAIEPIPEEVLAEARRCLVDWLAAAFAGLQAPSTRILLGVQGDAVDGIAVPGIPGRRLDPVFAALAMGNAGHALDYDDTDHVALIHVSSTLFPALLALAALAPGDGQRFLRNYVAAYEAEDRIGQFLGRPLTARGWHVSGVIGHLGAALVSALALGLPAGQGAQAMAIASTGASGLIAGFGSMSKHLQVGRAAAAGVLAARLAQRGYDGPTRVLDDAPGMCGPFIGAPVSDWGAIGSAWGNPFAVTRNSFKPHASCMITHPVIDACVALGARCRQAGVGPESIAGVECRVNVLAPQVAGIASPSTGLEGKFSVAYCAAIGLVDGSATPDRFTPDALDRPVIRDLLGRIRVVVDPAIGEQQAFVRLRAVDGQMLEEHVAIAKGNPANPMDDRELGAKFLAAAGPVLGRSAEDVLAELRDFDRIPDVGRWTIELNTRLAG